MYKLFFRLVFQRMDPERAHHLAFRWIRLAVRVPVLRTFVAAVLAPRHKELRTEAFGLRMHGPFGLAAGFDKNAVAIDGMSMLGFDHVEIGTVTGEPQPGNPKKRLFRLVPDRALINRMGFNNDGSLAVARRLATRTPVFRAVVGVNIGKTKVVPEAEAAEDYVKSTERLAAHADYLVVNVSSPNTPGLRNLQSTEALRPLLTAVREAADRTVPGRRVPLLVKIAPDLADEDVDAVADLAVELGLDGIIATNTTIAREGLGLASEPALVKEAGGLSGAPLRARSLEVLRRLYARVGTASSWWAWAASRTRRTPGSASWPAPPWCRVTAPSSTRGPSGGAPSTRGSPHGCAPAPTPPSPTRSAPT
ncbi:Dihydroorotate dehydrogenase (quinone) [Streptomyces sp. MBT84]|nr:Dihydroorotate dehydrogenase (quinone) [Streptomyces sp. MBT84]